MTDEQWPGMPQAKFDGLCLYIQDLMKMMGLTEWTVKLQRNPLHGPDGDGNEATCWIADKRRIADISLAEWFNDKNLEEQRHTLVHELVHLHLEPMVRRILTALTPTMGQEGCQILTACVRHDNEYTVDNMADWLAPLLPLYDPLKYEPVEAQVVDDVT